MRCVGSSPSAALSALRTRLDRIEELEDQLCDEDEAEGLDVEPASVVTEDPPLLALIEQAERLTKAPDPKLEKIITLLRPLIAEGSKPSCFAGSLRLRIMLQPAFARHSRRCALRP